MFKQQFDIKKVKNIIVNHHAVDQYKDRVKEEDDEDNIRKTLKEIIIKGQVTRYAPRLVGKDMDTYDLHMEYRHIGISAEVKNESVIIMTCTGTYEFRKWYRQQEKVLTRRNAVKYAS